MGDYKKVAEALQAGAEPKMLCATCPWDRYCITPPSMTAGEVEQQMADAKKKDDEAAAKAKAEGKQGGMPMSTLLMGLAIGAADKTATVCPVFVARLRAGSGRAIVDSIKSQMQGWDDDA